MAYATVVIPEHIVLLENTQRLLDEFRNNGGRIISPEDLQPRTDVVDNPSIIYTKRIFRDRTVYYFLNQTRHWQKASIGPGSYIIDQVTGEKKPFTGFYEFAPCETLLLADDGTSRANTVCSGELLDITGVWKVEAASPNLLTLDHCDYYFDGQLVEENGYVLNIQDRALALERPVNIRQEYRVLADTVPEEVFLLCETPEIFQILVNGKSIDSTPTGWMIDKAFQKLDITDSLHIGENTISFEVEFRQSEEVYQNLKKSRIFESEKNKLTYDMEIDACYLAGSFGVRLDGYTEQLERDAIRFHGSFVLCDLPKTVTLSNLELQGFPFFAGSLRLSKQFDLLHSNYRIQLAKKAVNAVEVSVNGTQLGTALFLADQIDCSKALQPGTNEVTLTLYNTLRNMLGPHHLEEGESYHVSPGVFPKEPSVWNRNNPVPWNDGYCFVETGLSTNL